MQRRWFQTTRQFGDECADIAATCLHRLVKSSQQAALGSISGAKASATRMLAPRSPSAPKSSGSSTPKRSPEPRAHIQQRRRQVGQSTPAQRRELVLRLPRRVKRQRSPALPSRECPAHRAWVRRHHCCVPGCTNLPVDCAHVHADTDGGMGLKPSDKWTISLCRTHHIEQHQIGEAAFEKRHKIEMRALAMEFAKRSPHRAKL